MFRLLFVRGVSVIVGSVVAAVIAMGLVDYAVRFSDRGVLVIFAAGVCGVLAWTVYRSINRLRGVRLGDTELALQIEARFPAAKDRLASAVEFLTQTENDAAAGSAAMRRAAIAQATAQCEEIDFGSALDVRPAFHSAVACLAVFLFAAVLVALNPAAARIALARLTMPLSNATWPQRTHLQLKNPVQRVARGQSLEVEVIDACSAGLPAVCRVHYRFRDARGKWTVESEEMHPLGEAMTARRENLTRDLEFRVTGGDDLSMPWMPVEVLDPAVITSLVIDVVPPAYAAWPRETRDAASSMPILAGSRVELSGESSKPLRTAVLRLNGGRDVPARIEGDGRRFRIGVPSPELPAGLVLEEPSGYTIALVDRDGIRGGGEENWQFRVQSDAPPSAVIHQPKSNLFVTPRAHVDVQIDARDDLALRQVALVCSASGATASAESSLLLYEGPSQAPASAASALGAGYGDRRTISRRWDLEELKLRPGMRLSIYAAASDFRGQTGRSESRTLIIVTPEELQNELAARQGKIVTEVIRLLQLQREAREWVRAAELRLRAPGALNKGDIDSLQEAESVEAEISRGLGATDEGASALARSVVADCQISGLDNPDCTRRMQCLLDEFDRLQRDDLVPVTDNLTAAVKGVQLQASSPRPPVGRDVEDELHLARAGQHQEILIAALEDLLSQLRQWDDYRRFQREVAQLIRDQEEVARGAAELGRQTLGRDSKELSPQLTADLTALVQRQSDLARRQDRIDQEMEQTVPLLRSNEPVAADTLSDALNEARQQGIAAAMQTLADRIRDNGLGQAPADHRAILQSLQNVLDILTNNRSQDSQRLARELDASARDLEGLRKRQENLRRKLDELAAAGSSKPSDNLRAELKALAREQELIRHDTLQLGHRLERLQAKEPANSANEAADKMKQAESASESGSVATVRKQATDAERRLADAADKLKQKQAEIRVPQALEQQARLEDAIRRLHRQESQIEKETREFAAIERLRPTEPSTGVWPARTGPPASVAERRGRPACGRARRGERLSAWPLGRSGGNASGCRVSSGSAGRSLNPAGRTGGHCSAGPFIDGYGTGNARQFTAGRQI